MRLYIAEKPSMGREIAKCLKGPARGRDGYIETAEGIVTWAFGHILRQAEPEEYDAKYKFWRADDLPIIPSEWKLVVSEPSASQFRLIASLVSRADEIVNAGDPDREGQLLIDEVLDYLGNKKPVLRILLNALDEKSIREANASLRDNREFLPLKMSALARARADWLIGMNLSRAYTLAARRAGHDAVFPVGRVKTPTLALVVRREREIKNFRPVAYFTIKAEFSHKNGSFEARWKPDEMQPGLDSEGRLVDGKMAREKFEKFSKATENGFISEYQKSKKEEPQRLPFSLSSLQILAGKRFGYDPQTVLDSAQRLYEKKLTSYPRSDCEYLPKNQFGASKTILKNLSMSPNAELSAWAKGADGAIKSRAWNDSKITAHHAIIPTTALMKPETLSAVDRNIYFLIAQAYIAQFYPAHVYDQTKIAVSYMGERFTASGRTVRRPGWKALYGAAKEQEEPGELPPAKKKDSVSWTDGALEEKTTKPPERFTPSTLLAAMKDVHKFVSDPAVKKKLKDASGIGTEATRSAIIDDLIRRGFMTAAGKKKILAPTASAELLVDALPDDMTTPDKTAVWEDALHSMAAGDGDVGEFLASQEDFARALCEKALTANIAPSGKYPCPRCKRGVLVKRRGKNGDFWGCTNYPNCRMSADDKNGEPDLSARRFPPQNAAPRTAAKAILCPRCREGSLRIINGRNGAFWGCTNYPRCTATYDDDHGYPVLAN